MVEWQGTWAGRVGTVHIWAQGLRAGGLRDCMPPHLYLSLSEQWELEWRMLRGQAQAMDLNDPRPVVGGCRQ